MKRFLALSLFSSAMTAAAAQQTIPVRRIATPAAVSKDTVGFVFGVRELPGGRLLVNDAGARRLLLFDVSLSAAQIVADSASGSSSPYGKRASAIIAFTGDTTLLVDVTARAFVAFDAVGKPVSVLSAPRPGDVGLIATPALGEARTDPNGRLVYRGALPIAMKPPEAGKPFVLPEIPDSAPVVRADFDRRTADTLAWVRIPKVKASTTALPGGGMKVSVMVNPLSLLDDWTMLPDGSVAILRGSDYHIDWINADGTRRSSPRMPFDWKRLSDDEKAAIIDSTRKQVAQQFAAGITSGDPSSHGGNGAAVAGHSMTILKIDATDGGPAPRVTPGANQTISAPEVVPVSELPDYVPPVLHSGTMTSDPMGNVWILPSTSSASGGGLLYDIVNRKGEVFQRVRLPAGRALAGFGANGTIYLTSHDAGGAHIERTRVE